MADCAIIGTGRDIWAVNPHTKQRLRLLLAKDRCPILDIYADNKRIYHAGAKIEMCNNTSGKDPLYNKIVQIADTISGNHVKTIGKNPDFAFPLNETARQRIEFEFIRYPKSLAYVFFGIEEDMIPLINCESQEHPFQAKGNEIYDEQKRIARFDENIEYLTAVDMPEFEKTFRKKNIQRYKKNIDFFVV